MRHDAMMAMSLEQLDQYGRVIGVDVTGRRTKAQKVELIESRRERTADVDALGRTFTVPVKAMHDKRVTDVLRSDAPLTDEGATQLLARLLGEEQYAELVELCTDDDGTVDVEAMALAFAQVVRSEELKNF